MKMKKTLAILLALMLVLSLAACGGDAPVEPATPDEPVAPVEGDSTPATDWNDYADVFTVTFYGLTEAGEVVAFVMNEDESLAALAIANTDTMESVSFVGAMEAVTFEDGTSGYSITDETNGLVFSFSCEYYDDGTVALDLGDHGAMAIAPCEPSEAFDLLNSIDAATVAVA